jgi:hypothetical protein
MSRSSWSSLSALALGVRLAFAAHPASAAPAPATPVQPDARAIVYLYAFVDQAPMAGVSISLAGAPAGTTDAKGVWSKYLPEGTHELVVTRTGEAPITVPLTIVAREQLQLSVSWLASRAPFYTVKSSVSGERTVDLTPAPAAVAQSTEPSFEASADAPEVEAGGESAPRRQPRDTTLTGMEVQGELLRTDDQAAYTDEKRATSQVFETLSAEQITRAGDTDTAQALKRVTGLTIVDSRFVYVRGLGERYSNVLLNGAQIPSPDPTRRVVPLDLFPTEILDGIIVQKTYSPDMPGDFGGGTIQLRTKSYPDDFFIKVSGKLGYVDGTTGEDGLTYDGGDRDWTGHDDGTRELPSELRDATSGGRFLRELSPLVPNGSTPQQIEQFGESIARGYSVKSDSIAPDTGFSFSIGDKFKFNDDVKFGYVAAFRYANDWDTTSDYQQTFTPTNAGLELSNFGEVNKTEQEINVTGFIATGLDIGPDHHLSTATTMLRQTTDETRVFEGRHDSVLTRITNLNWIENSLTANQIGGEHRFPALQDLGFDWQYTDARARRYAPDERRYRYDLIDDEDGTHYEFSSRSDNLSHNFSNLDDDTQQIQATWRLPLTFGETSVDLSAGIDRLDRDRVASIRRYGFQSPSPGGGIVSPDVFLFPALEQILTPGNIAPLGFRLFENTRQTDNYVADQSLDAEFVNADIRFGERFRLALGARHEDNQQTVTTFSIASATQQPVVAALDESDVLPSATFTWTLTENSQLRAAFAETRSRPDFRELSPAPFTDPEQDAESLGNPDLETAGIKHYDLRYEYYFDGTDAISVAYFRKDFDRPIETLRLPFLSTLLSFENALSARNQGIEIDAYKHLGFVEEWSSESFLKSVPWSDIHVGFNYAYIDSDVQLDPASSLSQTNQERPLQGQSPYVVNLQLGYSDPENESQWTLLFNRFGKRIAQVGIAGAPDIYEQSANQLDFQYEHALGSNWRWKLRLRNLLDPEIEYLQGGETTRSFKRGREIALILEWVPELAR